ncbi:hypothetical protein ZH60_16570 [Salmonella enterica subsp. enterica]|nr:hypothetical protein [Salmonella enterica subsp. enterica serovar Chandans]EEJ0119810.1 hypothetical protein [Salmonella enterica subsp. enterica serovar Chandans]MIP20048.1 hypothetical protein [Salmonella enterica subsp. enterica serovar Chandans]
MKDDHTQDQEEKFLWVIDKYITRHCHSPKGNDFYRKFYMLFVGYHLKYFYAQAKYSNSCFHVDNIMQMFSGVASCLNGNLLSQFTNGNTLLQSLSSLVNYISQDVAGAERIYADLLAQYEKKRIAGSMTYTPRPGARKRL